MQVRAKELRQMWKRKKEAHKAQAKAAAGAAGDSKSVRAAKKSEA
jgi:hypothetical protein